VTNLDKKIEYKFKIMKKSNDKTLKNEDNDESFRWYI
jgi:hypothetical protein